MYISEIEEKTSITENKLETAADMLKALAHPMRIAIVDLLKGDNRLTVGDIFHRLGMEQAVASHHLRILKDRNIVESEREGKNMFYHLKFERLSQIIECIEKCSV
jgi:DNA-binding transcriptional ArsR family regulator